MRLEPEPDLSYIGCELHVLGKSIELSYKVPGFYELSCELGFGDFDTRCRFIDQLWRYRVSHDDRRALTSGLNSRLFGAARLSFPVSRCQPAVMKVFSVSLHLQHPSQMLLQLLSKHARKFPVTYNNIFAAVRESIVLGGPNGVMRLISSVEQLEPR